MGRDDTTERLFPHQMVPISTTVEKPVADPLPMQKSIRQEFIEHRIFIEDELKAWRAELGAALQQVAPAPTVDSAMRRGLALARDAAPKVVATLALLEVVVPILKPEWMGPLKALREAFGAAQ